MSIEDIIRITAIASGVYAVAWWRGRKDREKARKDKEAFLKKTPEEREKDFELFKSVLGDSVKKSETEQKDKSTLS